MPLHHYITLGRSGLRASPFCLGTMTFGEDLGWGSGVAFWGATGRQTLLTSAREPALYRVLAREAVNPGLSKECVPIHRSSTDRSLRAQAYLKSAINPKSMCNC